MASDRLRRDREEKTVILDSSAIMMLFEFSIDLKDELTRLLGSFHVIVPRPIIAELRFLSEHGKGKKRLIAKPALKLIKRYEIVDSEETGDESVLSLARNCRGIVVTNDRELRKKAKKESLQTIYLREKSKLILE
jgi:rRNA-processing protein FCF1